MTIDQLLDTLQLGEDQDIEFKAADGGLPRSRWDTVSAFANTDGGYIVLGVAERDGGFIIEGVRKPETLLKTFWDGHNNPQKLAHRFGEVGNEDIQHYRKEHSRDIGTRLGQMATSGWLEKAGHGRGTRYRWPATRNLGLFDTIPNVVVSSEHLQPSSEHLKLSSEHLSSEQEDKLLQIAVDVRGKGKVPKVLMESTILSLCREDWLSLRTLARLLNREPDSLRNHYITAMLRDGRLQARVPGKSNHPNQAYRTTPISR